MIKYSDKDSCKKLHESKPLWKDKLWKTLNKFLIDMSCFDLY